MKKTNVSAILIVLSLGPLQCCKAFTLQTALSTISSPSKTEPNDLRLPSIQQQKHQHGLLFMNEENNGELDSIKRKLKGYEYSVLPEFEKSPSKKQSKRTIGRRKKFHKKPRSNSGEESTTPKYKKLSDILYSSSSSENKIVTKITEPKQKKKNIVNAENVKPWCANYTSSSAIQKKIQLASKDVILAPIDRATNVAKTLLNTPPEWCNESNVVYTLTLSAKVLTSSSLVKSTSDRKKQSEFRSLLLEILDILHELINHDKKLNTRQLANVSWAIAKHYKMDHLILPQEHIQSKDLVYSSTPSSKKKDFVSYYEEWDLKKEEQRSYDHNDIESRKRRIMETLDGIAKSLITSIEKMNNAEKDEVQIAHKSIKAGEISMICWAYSTIFPRQRPPGWELPPRSSSDDTSGRLTGENLESSRDLVLFQSWESTESFGQDTIQRQKLSLVDNLFDVMAQRLIWYHDESSSVPMTNELSWKEISTISWAFAHRGIFMSNSFFTLVSQMTRQAIDRLEKMENDANLAPLSRDVSEIAWSLGVLQTDNFVFSDVMEEFVEVVSAKFINHEKDRPLQDWSTADCVQLAVAMAHGRIDDQILLEYIYNEAMYSLNQELDTSSNEKTHKRFQGWELSILLWVQARLYLTSEISETFDRFADNLPQILQKRMQSVIGSHGQRTYDKFSAIGLGAQETANLCWSLTVLDKHESSNESMQLIHDIFRYTATSCENGKGMKLEHAHQLWQSYFLLDVPTDNLVNDSFIMFLKSSWDQEKGRRKASSARHKALSQTLKFMGVAHYNEHDEDIDVAIVLKTDSKWLHTASQCDGEECHTKVAVE